ncbi:MAG: diguanylate cyclase [Alphaproteobacteria bacterium]
MLREWFIAEQSELRTAMAYDYDYRLVALSIVIAILAAYCAFDTFDRLNAASNRISRFAWLATGAVTLGGGIWSMHFIAMLAVEMDMAVRYDVTLTILSAAAAVVASGLAKSIVSKGTGNLPRIICGGVILGAGIGVMHYMGMSAMRMAASIKYDPLIFAVSIVVAVVLSSLSLRMLQYGYAARSLAVKSFGSVLMGASIASMHYTGMAATYYTPGESHVMASNMALSHHSMAIVIGSVAFVVTQLTLIASIVSRQFEEKDRELTSQGIYLEKVLENAVDGITLIKPNGEIIVANPVMEACFGYSESELIGHNISMLMDDENARRHDNYLRNAQGTELKIRGAVRELSARRKDGSDFPVDIAVSSIELPDGRYFMGIIRDITNRKSAEEERERLISELRYNRDLMEEQAAHANFLAEELNTQKQLVEENQKRSDYLARHDVLTQLPNRRYFFEYLEAVLCSPEPPDCTIAVLFIDLDKFKLVNDVMGHERGDNLLIQVAERIGQCIRETDMVARLGGDEFAVAARVINDEEAQMLADRICGSLQITVDTSGEPIVTGASIGVAIYPINGDNIDDLMKSADTAMYQAKNAGRNRVRLSGQAAGA